nr:sensor domain-containing phosphodiesterase [Kineococcus aurantiacus]
MRLGERLRGLGVPAVSPSYEALAREASDEVLVTGADGSIKFCSPTFSRRWGIDRWALLGHDAFGWVHPEDRAAARAVLTAACEPGAGPRDSDHRYLVRSTGEVRWTRVRFSDARHVPGVRGVVWNCRDTTDERRTLEALRHHATHDPLTGLPNRRHLTASLATRAPTSGLLLVGLDGLKAVNDRYGHGAGDEVVRRVADRLGDVVGADGHLARLDGDEFAVLLHGPEATVGRALAALSGQVVRAVREPVEVAGRPVSVTASVGTAVVGAAHGAEDGRELFRRADVALTAAKQGGRDRAVPFSHALLDAAHERAELAADLRYAVGAGEMHVVYQPLVDLARDRTVGFEALVRWQHPQRGNVPPAVFVPIAEESETILEVGEFVLDTALAAAARFGGDVEVSVNLSGQQLLRPGLADLVAGRLRHHGVEPSRLCLEVTESAAVADLAAAREVLGGLRALGVRTALDDFGTGYSSLSYLRRLPVDILKVDKSFLDDVAEESGVAVLSGIVELARALGLVTVAEGIETDQVRSLVASAGCTWGQGYLFARPLTEDAAVEHLRQNERWRRTTA